MAWEDPDKPESGFKYLYLTPDDYEAVAGKNIVHTELVHENGEAHYKITDIIGQS